MKGAGLLWWCTLSAFEHLQLEQQQQDSRKIALRSSCRAPGLLLGSLQVWTLEVGIVPLTGFPPQLLFRMFALRCWLLPTHPSPGRTPCPAKEPQHSFAGRCSNRYLWEEEGISSGSVGRWSSECSEKHGCFTPGHLLPWEDWAAVKRQSCIGILLPCWQCVFPRCFQETFCPMLCPGFSQVCWRAYRHMGSTTAAWQLLSTWLSRSTRPWWEILLFI